MVGRHPGRLQKNQRLIPIPLRRQPCAAGVPFDGYVWFTVYRFTK